jgi:hypothetical protein
LPKALQEKELCIWQFPGHFSGREWVIMAKPCRKPVGDLRFSGQKCKHSHAAGKLYS